MRRATIAWRCSYAIGLLIVKTPLEQHVELGAVKPPPLPL